MRKYLWMGALAVVAIGGIVRGDAAPIGSASNDRIHYDSQCYTIDGKDTFIFSGSFHYFRCPKPLWAQRFEKMKQAGLNCVETYVPWNWHEQTPPASVDDFSQMNMSDLNDWLDMAINQFGFYVILRPGPYICAEWDGGGYPQWLLTKKPAGAKTPWFRRDDPAYLAWCRHWYAAVAKTAVPWQLTHRPVGRPGVILWQIENEYDGAALAAPQKLHQLQALAHDSRDLGIDVPLITCITEDPLFRRDPFLNQNVVECRNTYPSFNFANEARDLTRLETYQPDRPRLVTELQGGWFSDVGRRLSQDMGFTAAQINHVTLLAWAHGFTGTNYYMMFGGTNIGDWGSAQRTTSYDYAAPIREWGGVGPRNFAVAAMGRMIQQHAAKLVRTVAEKITLAQPAPADLTILMRRAADGSRYLFVLNDNRNDSAKGEVHLSTVDLGQLTVRYDLAPVDAKVLYLPQGASEQSQGEWLPAPVGPPRRPTQIPAAVNITQVRRQVDPGPVADSWRVLRAGDGIEDAGIYDRRFVFYRASLSAADSAAPLTLSAKIPAWAGAMIAQLNGTRLDVHGDAKDSVIAALPSLKGKDNQLLVLFENGGRTNFGGDMERKCGPADLTIKPSSTLALQWQISGQTVGQAGKWWETAMNDSAWPAVNVGGEVDQTDPSPVSLVWYRFHFDLPAPDPHVWVPWKLHLSAAGNGFIYLNGRLLGRWWEVGPQYDFYLPECWLNRGPGASNVVALCLRPTKGPTAVRSASVSPYADFAETR